MFTRPFHPERFLQSIRGTRPFVDYCQDRGVRFEEVVAAQRSEEALRRWTSALADLPGDAHALVELELAKVNEMASPDAHAHLLEVADATEVPPVDVPGGAPLALWFLLRHPALFHEVFLHHAIEEVESWRTASTQPGIDFGDLEAASDRLSAELRRFFSLREGTGSFCTVEGVRLAEATCFLAQIADRLQFFDTFGDDGAVTTTPLRPALPVLFAYYPLDGTVLLKSHLRSRERTSALLDCFARSVLRSPIREGSAFDLEALKGSFRPLPDAADMELVRLKSLHLRYPQRKGQRLLKLETLSSDQPDAIEQLLSAHLPGGALQDLRVCHAEIQVRLRVQGRSKNYLIRLWPHRCNLSQTPLGDRFRSCLRRWGLTHARKP